MNTRTDPDLAPVSREQLDVKYVADLARLKLTEDEVGEFERQLGQVIGHMRQLREVDVEGVEPMAHASPVFNVLRADEPQPGLGRDEALAVAPRAAGGLFMVTKVIE